jgi:uncharacterized protein
MSELLAGLALGFLGSLHCVGMCGPLALALPGAALKRPKFVVGRLLYNLGRVVLYILLGTLVGSLGSAFRLSGYQQGLSIAVGAIILAAFLLPAGATRWMTIVPVLSRWEDPLRAKLASLMQRRSLVTLFGIGMLNGFLPCGFVYLALGTAATLGGIGASASFMVGFGCGTIPAMFGVSLLGKRIGAGVRGKFVRLVPVLASVIAVLVIMRGMNLGIPFVSPHVQTEQTEPASCH